MGKDQPVFDADSEDRCRVFKVFLTNFRDFCIIEDIDSNDYWISAKRSKAMAELRRAFPQAE